MPPLPPLSHPHTPRLIVYHQTHHTPSGEHVPLLPLISTPLTHLILAAIHLNAHPTTPTLTLNDHPPSHPRNTTLFAELRLLQSSGIKVLGMLGGAAKGSFAVLDSAPAQFETYYSLLHRLISAAALDGLDLDVEEPMSLPGILRLIDRLRSDFGPSFVITLAPVATALLSRDPRYNLSGFDYAALETVRGREIAWYNAQFYCGWGDASTPAGYMAVTGAGWDARRVVLGVVTNARNGAGFVGLWALAETVVGIGEVVGRGWGGVMGWEYFNALPGGDEGRPWEWVEVLGGLLGSSREGVSNEGELEGTVEIKKREKERIVIVVVDGDGDGEVESVPAEFEYFSDMSDS